MPPGGQFVSTGCWQASPLTDMDIARFDLALTVSAMRYVSDLHIGKVNPEALSLRIRHRA